MKNHEIVSRINDFVERGERDDQLWKGTPYRTDASSESTMIVELVPIIPVFCRSVVSEMAELVRRVISNYEASVAESRDRGSNSLPGSEVDEQVQLERTDRSNRLPWVTHRDIHDVVDAGNQACSRIIRAGD